MFLTSHKISVTNCRYTEGDGSVESLVLCKLLYIVQSIDLSVSKMNSKYTRLGS